MQVTRIRKGMLWTLVMVLLCTMLPVAMAAQTTLSVSFNGLRATSEGQWMTEPLTGTFEVWSGTTLLGQVTAHPQDGSAYTLALSSTEEITLRPVMETMPEGYLIQDAPISVSIAEGKENNPPVLVYADAGLFTVQGEVNASFAVLKLQQDEAGEETLEEVLTFPWMKPETTSCPRPSPRGTMCFASSPPPRDVRWGRTFPSSLWPTRATRTTFSTCRWRV